MQSYKKKTVLNAQYSDILSASNCSTLTCLRSLSEEALTNAIDDSYEIGYTQGLYAYGDFYYGPAVDGRIIQDLPSQELEAKRHASGQCRFGFLSQRVDPVECWLRSGGHPRPLQTPNGVGDRGRQGERRRGRRGQGGGKCRR